MIRFATILDSFCLRAQIALRPKNRVPHLRDGFIVAKVDNRAKRDPSLHRFELRSNESTLAAARRGWGTRFRSYFNGQQAPGTSLPIAAARLVCALIALISFAPAQQPAPTSQTSQGQ